MVDKVEIKDKDGIINIALRSVGFNINKQQTELLLNTIDFVRKTKGEATIKDMAMINSMVDELFEE